MPVRFMFFFTMPAIEKLAYCKIYTGSIPNLRGVWSRKVERYGEFEGAMDSGKKSRNHSEIGIGM